MDTGGAGNGVPRQYEGKHQVPFLPEVCTSSTLCKPGVLDSPDIMEDLLGWVLRAKLLKENLLKS